jgi:hypothetical protein
VDAVRRGVAELIAAALTLALFPLVVPAILSRSGWLSVGRWSALAGFCITASVGVVFIAYHAQSDVVNFVVLIAWSLLFASALGCFLAAALHPKTP